MNDAAGVVQSAQLGSEVVAFQMELLLTELISWKQEDCFINTSERMRRVLKSLELKETDKGRVEAPIQILKLRVAVLNNNKFNLAAGVFKSL